MTRREARRQAQQAILRFAADPQFDKTEREAPFQLAALIARPMRVQA